MKVATEIPLAAGLGSSASYSVALAASLLFLYDQIKSDNIHEPKSKDLINKWAYQCERVIHGQPSGIDNSTCTYGGALFFKNGQICEKVEKYESLCNKWFRVFNYYSKIFLNYFSILKFA